MTRWILTRSSPTIGRSRLPTPLRSESDYGEGDEGHRGKVPYPVARINRRILGLEETRIDPCDCREFLREGTLRRTGGGFPDRR